jgi:hypothetical protein
MFPDRTVTIVLFCPVLRTTLNPEVLAELREELARRLDEQRGEPERLWRRPGQGE